MGNKKGALSSLSAKAAKTMQDFCMQDLYARLLNARLLYARLFEFNIKGHVSKKFHFDGLSNNILIPKTVHFVNSQSKIHVVTGLDTAHMILLSSLSMLWD